MASKLYDFLKTMVDNGWAPIVDYREDPRVFSLEDPIAFMIDEIKATEHTPVLWQKDGAKDTWTLLLPYEGDDFLCDYSCNPEGAESLIDQWLNKQG